MNSATAGSQVQWHSDLAALPAKARALLEHAGAKDIYTHPAWLHNLVAEVDFGPRQRPGHALLLQDGQARIVLPLLQPLPASVLPQLRCATSLANYYSALAMPACAEGVTADDWCRLLGALRSGLAGPLDSLQLGPLDLDSPACQALHQGMQAAGWRTRPYFCFGNWVQQLPARGEAAERWPKYWAQREGALRNTAERMRRRFARAGGRLEVISGADGAERVAAALAAYQDVYARSWKGAEPHPGFMPGLVRTAAAQGWLRMGLAWLGTQPVAAQVWLVQGASASIYKLAYREDAAVYSPGTLLTALLMQHVMEDPAVLEIDYGMGDDAYKKQWMGQRRERWGLQALNPGSAGGRWLMARRWAAGRLARLRGRPGPAVLPVAGRASRLALPGGQR